MYLRLYNKLKQDYGKKENVKMVMKQDEMNNSINIQSQSIVSPWSPSGHGQMLPEASLKFHLSGELLQCPGDRIP